jgi:beta-lactamase class A
MWNVELDRRSFVIVAASAALSSCRVSSRGTVAADFESELAQLERGGRLGVAVFDTADGTLRGRRLDERFALCSTFKLVLAAQVLERAAAGGAALDTRVRFGPDDVIAHAPIVAAVMEAAAARGASVAEATLGELAEAIQTRSDGAAANLLLREIGGPQALNAFCRANGDHVSRLDRYEPQMNDVRPGDERDTTTPRAMAGLVARLFTAALAPTSRRTLREWMIATRTGEARVRRGLPATWVAGDKTGTGGGDGVTVKCNDVVWIEPPGRAPLVAAVYYDTGVVAEWPSAADEEVLAEVGRAIGRAYGPR